MAAFRGCAFTLASGVEEVLRVQDVESSEKTCLFPGSGAGARRPRHHLHFFIGLRKRRMLFQEHALLGPARYVNKCERRKVGSGNPVEHHFVRRIAADIPKIYFLGQAADRRLNFGFRGIRHHYKKLVTAIAIKAIAPAEGAGEELGKMDEQLVAGILS